MCAWHRYARLAVVIPAVGAMAALSASKGGVGEAVILIAAALLAWSLAWPAMIVGETLGLIAKPGGRSIHDGQIPLTGGLAAALPLFAGLVILGGGQHAWLLAAAGVILAAGTFDDRYSLSPKAKLLAQALAAVLLFSGGYRIETLYCPPFVWDIPTAAQLPLMIFWVLLVTNAVNLIDGLDGLAAGLGILICAGLISTGGSDITPILLGGALLGFLYHNLPRGRMFLGDAGSMMMGLILSACLLGASGQGTNVVLAVGLLTLPIGDVCLCILRRLLMGKSVGAADRGHLHHRVLRRLKSPTLALGALLLVAATTIAITVKQPDLYGVILNTTVFGAFVIWVHQRNRTPLRVTLQQRPAFAHLQVTRKYFLSRLRVCRTRDDISQTLNDMTRDFEIANLRIGNYETKSDHVGRGSGALCKRSLSIADGNNEASWISLQTPNGSALEEEREGAIAEILRAVELRTRSLDARSVLKGSEEHSPSPIHLIVTDLTDLAQLLSLSGEPKESPSQRGITIICPEEILSQLTASELNASFQVIAADLTHRSPFDQAANNLSSYQDLIQARRPGGALLIGLPTPIAQACSAALKHGNIPHSRVGSIDEIAPLILSGHHEGLMALATRHSPHRPEALGSPLLPRSPDLVGPRSGA